MFNKDSISLPDSLMMRTLVTKRKVYASGGIVPDIFIPMDTSRFYRYFNTLVRKNIVFPFVVGFLDHNRDVLKSKYASLDDFRKNFQVTEEMMAELIRQGEKEKIKKDEESLKISGVLIKRQIKAFVARELFNTSAFYQIISEDDPELKKALEILSDQQAFNRYLGK